MPKGREFTRDRLLLKIKEQNISLLLDLTKTKIVRFPV